MSPIYQSLIKFHTDREWEFQRNDEQETLHSAFRGRNRDEIHFSATILDDTSLIGMACVHLGVSESRRLTN